MFSLRLVRAIAALTAAWVPAGTAWAQAGTSAISGFVKDGTGAALPGAIVKMRPELRINDEESRGVSHLRNS